MVESVPANRLEYVLPLQRGEKLTSYSQSARSGSTGYSLLRHFHAWANMLPKRFLISVSSYRLFSVWFPERQQPPWRHDHRGS